MTRPKVSISILNYQRRETLRLALERALAQDYLDLEVLVSDNASTDGSDRLVAEKFPSVRLIRLSENIGCAARNAGVSASIGDIVVTIDNDVLLMTPHAVENVVEIFERYPSVACVNFKILDSEGNLSTRDWCHPRDWRQFADQEFPTHYVLEGACAFRRSAFEQVGGYWAPLFLGHEGLDLGLRVLDRGYDLLYSPSIRVTHLSSVEARPSSRIYYTFTRNSIWVALRNHRPAAASGAIAKDMALMAFSSARSRHLGAYLRGIRHGLAGCGRALASRHALSRATYKKLKAIRALQPNLFEKAKRHWREQPI